MHAKALIIGGAGCCLPLTLGSLYPQISFKVIEIDEQVAQIAHQYFGAPAPNSKFQNVSVEINDGLKFVKNSAQQQSNFYDLIFIDAASSTEATQLQQHLQQGEIYGDRIITAPPREFLQDSQFWVDVKQQLNEQGLLVVNTLGPQGFQNAILQVLRTHFLGIMGVQFLDDKQMYLFCSRQKQIAQLQIKEILQQFDHSQQLCPILREQFMQGGDETVDMIYNFEEQSQKNANNQ
eukprot:TRINITY_DN9513_c0_g1_i5.p1 TRINITY_DN9513_c0_g1~~TRINITY_DN9513_c0_g1_i5.p1  ORF type:complete len:255 (-),score=32.18 TRINITY_DN9513_c0_g1_i5:131-835(-)